MLPLLRSFLPGNWFGTDVSEVFDRATVVSNEWLAGLWAYLVEAQALALFDATIPMWPIMQPAQLPPGSYTAKVRSSYSS
jgi:hypothetical protein